ncbi:hypothetical protein [Nitrosococcus wardiae]|nr:hypothetical protein [Nitrosococcus wardiae]
MKKLLPKRVGTLFFASDCREQLMNRAVQWPSLERQGKGGGPTQELVLV